MNEHDRLLEEKLEVATSSGWVDETQLEQETSQLRESWVAFTQLVETADERRESERVDRTVRNSVVHKSPQMWMALATAAGFMLVLAGWWMLSVNRQQGLVEQRIATTSFSGSSRSVEDSLRSTSDMHDSVVNGVHDEYNDESLAWDDSLDDEIALAEQSIFQLGEGWSGLDTQVEAFYDQIEQYEAEFGEETL